ncbi:hypothetical protein [Pontibacter ramchanderi]|uniref:Uncharacterized protein n=1 Tax=Pontibacter ramchanderi TaxID=1179743 RepID=A0A2N3UBN3_9BACT|nr:hypothetical protein [Pontibacter ramchanderi]PKV66783.1 hypothetical protein BD749_1917 [Pontibacter ramchanderi]
MKSVLSLVVLYLLLALLLVSCADQEVAVPACLQVEVVGPDCAEGWYVLQIVDADGSGEQRSNQYIGQLQSGFVTTDNLPEDLRHSGKVAYLALERNSEYGPRCMAIYMMFPPVRVKQVCSGG